MSDSLQVEGMVGAEVSSEVRFYYVSPSWFLEWGFNDEDDEGYQPIEKIRGEG